MRKYPKYKDSGVEFIGDIPDGWNLISLKYLLSSKITDGPHETPIFIEDGIPFLSAESVQDNKLDFNKKRGYISLESHQEYSKKCKPQINDILIVKSGSTTGKSTIVETDIEFSIWSPLCVVRSNKEKITPRFTFSSIQSTYFRRFVELGWSFGTQPNIGMGVIENIKLVVPPLSEQQQIVTYLDQKTSIIDQIISNSEKKIEILKEKRTSIINHTVTKGLNPNVKMKDSGVEWIGEIPAGWDLKPLKYVASINSKSLSENVDPDYELDYVEISDINNKGEILRTTKYKYSDSPSRCRRILSKGDVFISTVRTYLKSIGYVKDDVSNLICSTGFCVLTPNEISSEFLFYMVLDDWFINQVISNSEGVSYPSITSTELVRIKVLLPPSSEQKQIVTYLDQKTIEIDELISKEKRRVEIMKEYRQSLISEVVTGKIMVSNS